MSDRLSPFQDLLYVKEGCLQSVILFSSPLEQIQPGPPPCPVFHPEQTELLLPPDGFWVLRFPYAYVTERGPCYPPKENQPLASYRVLRGVLRANTVSPTP